MTINVNSSSCKVPAILVRCKETFTYFLDRSPKNSSTLNVMTIRPVAAEFFHADRGADG